MNLYESLILDFSEDKAKEPGGVWPCMIHLRLLSNSKKVVNGYKNKIP